MMWGVQLGGLGRIQGGRGDLGIFKAWWARKGSGFGELYKAQ